MTQPLGTGALTRVLFMGLFCLLLLAIGKKFSDAQNAPQERSFPQSKTVVEKALKGLQPSLAGHLPVLDGFTVPSDRPLERFQRAYYQCSIATNAKPSGGSVVRVSAKITAWYNDPVASRSGYQVLSSNGRLESDLLDRLEEALEKTAPPTNTAADSTASRPITKVDSTAPTISAPMPRIPDSALGGKPMPKNPADQSQPPSLRAETEAAEKHEQELAAEAKGLEEILHNQSHPNNLVAVKKTGTPVVDRPSADAKILFPATAGDEFEILDVNPDWVHIRISGLSRGWIRRSGLEMPDDSKASTQAGQNDPANAEPFHVSSEQFAPFPGDWEPLRGKTVKVVTVQKAVENAPNPGPQVKLDYAQALFTKEYAEVSSASDGIVLIFDSEDGGMVAATLPALQKWKTGALSDDAFWHQCFSDPPELLGLPASGKN
jgi:hypothetical protein